MPSRTQGIEARREKRRREAKIGGAIAGVVLILYALFALWTRIPKMRRWFGFEDAPDHREEIIRDFEERSRRLRESLERITDPADD